MTNAAASARVRYDAHTCLSASPEGAADASPAVGTRTYVLVCVQSRTAVGSSSESPHSELTKLLLPTLHSPATSTVHCRSRKRAAAARNAAACSGVSRSMNASASPSSVSSSAGHAGVLPGNPADACTWLSLRSGREQREVAAPQRVVSPVNHELAARATCAWRLVSSNHRKPSGGILRMIPRTRFHCHQNVFRTSFTLQRSHLGYDTRP
ncbi:MAG: hypothetical protein NTW87_11780 [Planctomycetota bacterium]|nr:hypothetical protein [Planctomycetota bacterium]